MKKFVYLFLLSVMFVCSSCEFFSGLSNKKNTANAAGVVKEISVDKKDEMLSVMMLGESTYNNAIEAVANAKNLMELWQVVDMYDSKIAEIGDTIDELLGNDDASWEIALREDKNLVKMQNKLQRLAERYENLCAMMKEQFEYEKNHYYNSYNQYSGLDDNRGDLWGSVNESYGEVVNIEKTAPMLPSTSSDTLWLPDSGSSRNWGDLWD